MDTIYQKGKFPHTDASRPVARAETPPSGDERLPLGARRVRALLTRHDVPPARHSTVIADLLGFAYAQAHRRLGGTVAWELKELERIAAHFGESLVDMLREDGLDDGVPAVLVVGAVRVGCRLWPGDALAAPPQNSLVALKAGDQWLVMAAPDAGAAPCHAILRITIVPTPARGRRIAVLDDHVGLATSIAGHLTDQGFEATPFDNLEELVQALERTPFDAYVIDWLLGDESAAELIRTIRASDRNCPIAILTGKMKSDIGIESEVAAAITHHSLIFFEKPFRLAIISAALTKALASR